MHTTLLFFTASTAILAAFGWLRATTTARQQSRQIKRRMGIRAPWDDAFEIDDDELLLDPTIELPERRSMVVYFGDLFDASARGQRIRDVLIQADIKFKPSESIALLIITGLISYIAAELLFRQGPVVDSVIAVVCAIILPWLFLRSRRGRRLQIFTQQLATVAELVSNGLRAGLALQGALELVARELSGPASEEFGRVMREVRLGGSIDESLEALLERMPSRDLEVMVTTLKVQRIAGGNLVKSMAALARTLNERHRTDEEIKTMIAEPKFASYIMPGLAIVILSMINYMLPGFLDILFRSIPGLVVLAIFLALQIGGFLVIQRIARIKV